MLSTTRDRIYCYSNATINGVINATNTGTTVGIVQPNGVFRSKGQGFIMTKDGEVQLTPIK